MDHFTDEEKDAMKELHTKMAELMSQAIDDGMPQEHAIHVAGNFAVLVMDHMPHTDDGAAALHNFITEVSNLFGEPARPTRH